MLKPRALTIGVVVTTSLTACGSGDFVENRFDIFVDVSLENDQIVVGSVAIIDCLNSSIDVEVEIDGIVAVSRAARVSERVAVLAVGEPISDSVAATVTGEEQSFLEVVRPSPADAASAELLSDGGQTLASIDALKDRADELCGEA